MNGRNMTFAMLIVAGISMSFALPAHGQMIEKIIDWDKEVTDAGGLRSWAGEKVDQWVGEVKKNIIDVAPYSESIKDAQDVYNLRSRNESKAMDLVNKGIKNFDDIQFKTFDKEADQVGFDYLKDGLGTAKEVIERKGHKLLEPLDEIVSSAKKQLGRVENVGKRFGEFKDVVGSRLDNLRDRFSSDEGFTANEQNPLKFSGDGSGRQGSRGHAAEPGEAIYSGPLVDRVEAEGATPLESANLGTEDVLESPGTWNNQEHTTPPADEGGAYPTSHEQTNEPTLWDNNTGEERTMPSDESKDEWIEVVPNEDLTGTDWVEIQPEQDYDPSLRDSDVIDPLARFISSTDTSAADLQVANYLTSLDPALADIRAQLQAEWDRIERDKQQQLEQIAQSFAGVQQELLKGFMAAQAQQLRNKAECSAIAGQIQANKRWLGQVAPNQNQYAGGKEAVTQVRRATNENVRQYRLRGC